MKKNLSLLLLSGLLLAPSLLQAADKSGLKMRNYAEVIIENLQVNRQYSMVETGNLPLEIVNSSGNLLPIEISVQPPNPKRLKSGYNAIPDTTWIQIQPQSTTVAANSTYSTDVKLLIPDEEKYYGQKYQAIINVRTIPLGGAFMPTIMELQGVMLFSVAPDKSKAPPADAKTSMNMMFEFMPAGKVMMENVPLGKKVRVKPLDSGQVFMVNKSKEKITYLLQSQAPQETQVHLFKGYEACPDPNFLTLEREEITLNPGQKKEIKMQLEIPDQPEYKDKKYIFLVSVSTGPIGAGVRYYQLWISTAK